MILEDLTKLKNLKDMLNYAAENYGDMDFMRYKSQGGIEHKTYKQFKAAADSFSRFLEKEGFSSPRVAIVGPTSFEWVVSFFGAADCGGVAVPLAPPETDDMNCKLMDFADVDVLVFDAKHRSLYEQAKETLEKTKIFISVDDTAYDGAFNISDILRENEGEYNKQPDDEKMCSIVFTSGTTGFPKGVMLSHKNYVYAAVSVNLAYPTQRRLCCLPLHHCFSFTVNITKSMVLGKTVCVNDNISNLIADMQLFKPDSLVVVPQIEKKIMFGAIAYAKKHPEIPFKQAAQSFLGGEVIDIICGGATLEPELIEIFDSTGMPTFNGYGMSECAPIIANNAVDAVRYGSVGKPIPCVQAKIVNGEILVKGPNVMLGYYKNPEATAEVFTEDGYLHTGDLGRFDDDGFLYVTGRCKNLILLDNGENVSAEMLEEKFATEPMVKEVVCYGENGAICAQMYLNKEYLLENNITDTEKVAFDLLTRVNGKLAAYQRISDFVIREIPFERTTSGKIRRSSLQKAKKEIIEPQTDSEKRVCAAVKDLLMLNEVSVTDNFFALGGTSLTATELAVSLNVKTQTVYDYPFLRLLASEIEKEKEAVANDEIDYNLIISETNSCEEKAPEFQCALLTGATGFLGAHILKELTERNIKINCLVRSKERFLNQMKYYFGEDIDLSNVSLVTGNIDGENLGLTPERYDSLAAETDVVFHVAANVHHAGDYSDLEKTNVFGTKNIIAFAKKAGAVLQHTSTVSIHGAATVFQESKTAVFDENSFNVGQHYKDNVYIHSKYCAEQTVLMARKDGLKANIYRIGNLTWRASDGKFQSNSADNGFLHRIHAILKLGIFNDNMEKYPTDLTAVDECAKAYVNLAFSLSVNKIYHMYNPNFLDTREMFRLLDKPYRHVSIAETIETVMANSADRDIHVYMFYLIISGRSANVEMKNDYTVERLAETGFRWSIPDRRYLTVSDNESYPQGHCLDFDEYEVKPMRKTGGTMTPIQKLTLGVMRDAQLEDATLFVGTDAMMKLREAMEKEEAVHPLIITFHYGLSNKKIRAFIDSFESASVFTSIKAEPTVKDVRKLIDLYKTENCTCIVAVGGGSVLDAAKITALCVTNPGRDMEGLCKLGATANDCAPLYAVPTTAGTGSEVTIFGLVTDEDENKKKALVSDKYIPKTVALDPELTFSVPALSTACTGIDALSHAVEAYVSLFADSFPEDRDRAPQVCEKIFGYLPIAVAEPENFEARSEMQLASHEAGLAFRRIGTGYIHAIAHRLGEIYHLPHGLAIAKAFTPVLRAYLPYAASPLASLAKKCGFADMNTENEKAAGAFIVAVCGLIEKVGIDLDEVPVKDEDIEEIVMRAQDEVKATGYPRPFSDERLKEIIESL